MGVERYKFTSSDNGGESKKEKSELTPEQKGLAPLLREVRKRLRAAGIVGFTALMTTLTGDRPPRPAEIPTHEEQASQEFIESYFLTTREATLDEPERPIAETPKKVAPEAYVQYIAANESLDSKKKEALTVHLRKIADRLSPEILWLLRRADQDSRSLRRKMPREPRLTGFEQLGVSRESLRKFFDTFPKDAVNGNVPEIKYYDDISEDFWRGHQRTHGTLHYPSATTGWSNKIVFHKRPNTFYKENIRTQIANLPLTAAHEISHAMDWEHNMNLKPSERAEFLSEAIDVFQEETRSPLLSEQRLGVGEIHPDGSMHPRFKPPVREKYAAIKNPEPNAEQYLRLVEWWPELGTAYLDEPWRFKKEALASEKSLIQKWLLKKDSGFNPETAQRSRSNAIGKLYNEIRNVK